MREDPGMPVPYVVDVEMHRTRQTWKAWLSATGCTRIIFFNEGRWTIIIISFPILAFLHEHDTCLYVINLSHYKPLLDILMFDRQRNWILMKSRTVEDLMLYFHSWETWFLMLLGKTRLNFLIVFYWWHRTLNSVNFNLWKKKSYMLCQKIFVWSVCDITLLGY
jgi:hypothetical protein